MCCSHFLKSPAFHIQESFLEDINCILNSGEVPDLFDNEEIDGINMDLKQEATENDIPDTRQAVYTFFIQRVRTNLHVVLALSPAGGTFRQRGRMNPALINCCTDKLPTQLGFQITSYLTLWNWSRPDISHVVTKQIQLVVYVNKTKPPLKLNL